MSTFFLIVKNLLIVSRLIPDSDLFNDLYLKWDLSEQFHQLLKMCKKKNMCDTVCITPRLCNTNQCTKTYIN